MGVMLVEGILIGCILNTQVHHRGRIREAFDRLYKVSLSILELGLRVLGAPMPLLLDLWSILKERLEDGRELKLTSL
jgi:hypothetical protein